MKSVKVAAAAVAACAAVAQGAVPVDPALVSLPEVPQAVNLGHDGLPELPNVNDIISERGDDVNAVSQETSLLERKLEEQAEANKARLLKQKAVFDRKLREQEEANRALMKDNAVFAKQIMNKKKLTDRLSSDAKHIDNVNTELKGEFGLMAEHLEKAQSFIQDTLEETDPTKSDELAVLKESGVWGLKAAPSFLQTESSGSGAEDEAGDQKPAISMAAQNVDAETASDRLVHDMENGLENLKAQGAQNEKKLKGMFMDNFKLGVKRNAALANQKAFLRKTMSNFTAYENKLYAANAEVAKTKETEQAHLTKAAAFLQKLAELAMAPAEEIDESLRSVNNLKL
eukprot:TRINITY_DN78649_c0_g1_i1.p1 TRINITY_DN78649_c0_g1~~TRINITY_DN78649_c0_g1_i1.p1  ORF type:complete len:343 (-),score=116.83 TRINITY_DN78649_c0_g1_i1:93-1121(-)